MIAAEAKLADLETDGFRPSRDPSSEAKFNLLEKDLADAQNTILRLESLVEAKDLERGIAEAKLAKSMQDLESLPQTDGDLPILRKELDDLRSQLTAALSRDSIPSESRPDSQVADLRGEIESLKVELELARELASRTLVGDPGFAKLQSQLADKYGEILELETDLQQANQRLAALAKTSPENQPLYLCLPFRKQGPPRYTGFLYSRHFGSGGRPGKNVMRQGACTAPAI